MPRLARLDAPGVLHHIIIRGIERGKIFRNDQDKDNFIDRLASILPATQTACYGWALMSNHAHFLFRSGTDGISNVMQRLLTGYAIWFNRKYQRHGQLFQNRYKSIICQEDLYFKELVRYIHFFQRGAKTVRTLKSTLGWPSNSILT
jgi:putative transposase